MQIEMINKTINKLYDKYTKIKNQQLFLKYVYMDRNYIQLTR